MLLYPQEYGQLTYKKRIFIIWSSGIGETEFSTMRQIKFIQVSSFHAEVNIGGGVFNGVLKGCNPMQLIYRFQYRFPEVNFTTFEM